jgi:hypothetical protein
MVAWEAQQHAGHALRLRNLNRCLARDLGSARLISCLHSSSTYVRTSSDYTHILYLCLATHGNGDGMHGEHWHKLKKFMVRN